MTTPTFSNVERVTRISIQVKNTNGTYVEAGMISDLTPSERRGITEHFTFGGDVENPKVNIPDLVKGKTLKCTSIALWRGNILTTLDNSSGDPLTSLVEQRNYFNIQEIRKKADNSETIVTTYEDCLISDWTSTRDLNKGDVTIVENVTIAYRKVTSSFA